LRFLKRSQSFKTTVNGHELTPSDACLLEEVVLRDFENRPLTVSEALTLKHLGSSATLHKRLKRLREWDFLDVQKKASDHRTKYLIATPLTIAHFERMGEAVQKALHG
jgi:hypothetical protein